jgi:hypothetical protein
VILGEHGGVKTMIWTVSSSQKQNLVAPADRNGQDREHQLKMSSAVDGLLSLSSNGGSVVPQPSQQQQQQQQQQPQAGGVPGGPNPQQRVFTGTVTKLHENFG